MKHTYRVELSHSYGYAVVDDTGRVVARFDDKPTAIRDAQLRSGRAKTTDSSAQLLSVL